MTNGQHRPVPRSNRTSLSAAMAPHYRAAIAMVERLQIRYALGLLASAKAAIATVASQVGANAFRFTSSSLLTASSNNDSGASIDGEDSVSPDAAFVDHLKNASSRVVVVYEDDCSEWV